MPQSLSVVYVHYVFSTQDRVPFLVDKSLRQQLHAHIAEVSNRLACPAVIVGGVEDHIHALVRQGRTVSQADWVKEVKRVSSHWVKPQGAGLARFAWQSGYGAFSVSATETGGVRRYIEGQEEHHKVFSFKEEFLELLAAHGESWDERYVWE